MSRFAAVLVLLLCPAFAGAQTKDAGADDKAPVPDSAAQQDAMQLARDVYGEEYGGADTPAKKTALAKRLLEQAGQIAESGADKFVLLKLARDVAARAGDTETAMQAVDTMAAAYRIDELATRAEAIVEVAEAARFSVQNKALARRALGLIDRYAAVDDYPAATRLAKIATSAAHKSRDSKLVREVAARSKQIEARAKAYAEVKEALATLQQQPENPEANLAVGRFLCLVKDDWARGISMLALGNHAAMKALAVKELEGTSLAEEQVALGDGWWELAEKEEGAAKERIQLHAGYWYRKALPSVKPGLGKIKIEKRLENLAEVDHDVAVGRPHRPAAAATQAGGTFFVCADDKFRLTINGKPAAAGGRKTVSFTGVVRVGDTIAAELNNSGYERGFMLFFMSKDGNHAFFTNPVAWRSYTPADGQSWWKVEASEEHPHAWVADRKYLRIAPAAGYGADAIWAGKARHCYVYHVVSGQDLKPLSGAAGVPAPTVAGGGTRGTIHACGDDRFDLAINGRPLAGGGQKASSRPVVMRAGDVITVKAYNARYERGFMLFFLSDDGKASFATSTATWKCHAPADVQRWWKVEPAAQHAAAKRGDKKYLRIPAAAGHAVEPIWGAGSRNSYLYHVVTGKDLAGASR